MVDLALDVLLPAWNAILTICSGISTFLHCVERKLVATEPVPVTRIPIGFLEAGAYRRLYLNNQCSAWPRGRALECCPRGQRMDHHGLIYPRILLLPVDSCPCPCHRFLSSCKLHGMDFSHRLWKGRNFCASEIFRVYEAFFKHPRGEGLWNWEV